MIPDVSEDSWKLKILGKSGLFKTRNKIAVEYVQSSLKIEQLVNIEPVRSKFDKGELDFDLMLQRDLDDIRIKDELIPYLQREKQVSFFPPILVVLLEVYKESGRSSIKTFYPELNEDKNFKEGTTTYHKRDYGNLFSVRIYKKNDKLERWLTKLCIGYDATLLAIDGQHRLVALQAVAGLLDNDVVQRHSYGDNVAQYKEEFRDLEIPITFIFVPASQGKDNDVSLLETFRQIFVDVNKNARKVSKMRNILLDENNVVSIFTRNICSYLRKNNLENKNDLISLDELEWDKESKEDQLSSDIAVTNLVFIQRLIESWIKDDTGQALKSSLNLDKIKEELEDEHFSYQDLRVDNFSHRQKQKIKDIFEKKFQKGFADIINSLPFVLERTQQVKKIKDLLEKELQKKPRTGTDPKTVIGAKNYLFGGVEYKTYIKNKHIKAYVRSLLQNLSDFDEERFMDLIRTQMFQLAFWSQILDLYSYSDEDFNSFAYKIKTICSSKEFCEVWQNIVISNKTFFEKVLKSGRGSYNSSKAIRNLISDYLRIFFYENKKLFNNLILDFANISDKIDKEKTRNSFLEHFQKSFPEDILDDAKTQKLDDFGKFLKNVYLAV